MKTYIFLLFSLLACHMINGQAYICPGDTTVTFLDLITSDQLNTVEILDGDYGYDFSSHTITRCEADTFAFIDYVYYISKDAQPVDTCYQRITVLVYDEEDITPILPRDTIIEEASYSDIQPENLNFTPAKSDFGDLFGHQDSIILDNEGPGATIKRTWLIPILCTADKVITHVQQITINNYIVVDDSPGIVYISAEEITVDSILAFIDDSRIDCGSATTINDIEDCICSNAEVEDDQVINLRVLKKGIDPDGVSTLDVVYTLRHILHIPPILESQAIIACDVNEDGKITSLDALYMRRLILGMIEEFPGSKNWVFLNMDQINESEKETIEITKKELCNNQLKILAIKKGDVNGTATGL